MTATAVPVTTWQGCYGDSWQDLIVPEAFAHPAKAARGLSHRIYRHLLDSGYVRPGMVVLDPFAGIGGFCLDALTYGLRYVGVELEPRFVALGQQNLDLWRSRYGFTGGTIVQGDSRYLRQVLAGAQVGCVVGSPPYEGSNQDYTNGWKFIDLSKRKAGPHTGTKQEAYGSTPGQLGAMPPGALISSPPYAGAGEVLGTHNGIDWSKAQEGGTVATPARQASGEGYGTSAGQLGAMSPGVVVSSPPWNQSLAGGEGVADRANWFTDRPKTQANHHGGKAGQSLNADYGSTDGQLGAEPDTFWSASAQIMQELSLLLPAGAVCAWVLKAYVSKKAIVPFPDQWRALCEAHGFETHEIIHASLIEEQGVQHNLFGNEERLFTKRASFFRRLAEKKGSPSIDHEDILIMRRASL